MTHLPLFEEWLVKEARNAAHAKQNALIMVVLGNPPYSGYSANQSEWIAGLPLTSDPVLFRRLCGLGAELAALHLLERDVPAIANYPVAGTNRVDTCRIPTGGICI